MRDLSARFSASISAPRPRGSRLLTAFSGTLDRAVGKIAASLGGIALRLVPAAKLAAAGTWITDWLRMLPMITATRGLVPKDLLRANLDAVAAFPTIIERQERPS